MMTPYCRMPCFISRLFSMLFMLAALTSNSWAARDEVLAQRIRGVLTSQVQAMLNAPTRATLESLLPAGRSVLDSLGNGLSEEQMLNTVIPVINGYITERSTHPLIPELSASAIYSLMSHTSSAVRVKAARAFAEYYILYSATDSNSMSPPLPRDRLVAFILRQPQFCLQSFQILAGSISPNSSEPLNDLYFIHILLLVQQSGFDLNLNDQQLQQWLAIAKTIMFADKIVPGDSVSQPGVDMRIPAQTIWTRIYLAMVNIGATEPAVRQLALLRQEQSRHRQTIVANIEQMIPKAYHREWGKDGAADAKELIRYVQSNDDHNLSYALDRIEGYLYYNTTREAVMPYALSFHGQIKNSQGASAEAGGTLIEYLLQYAERQINQPMYERLKTLALMMLQITWANNVSELMLNETVLTGQQQMGGMTLFIGASPFEGEFKDKINFELKKAEIILSYARVYLNNKQRPYARLVSALFLSSALSDSLQFPQIQEAAKLKLFSTEFRTEIINALKEEFAPNTASENWNTWEKFRMANWLLISGEFNDEIKNAFFAGITNRTIENFPNQAYIEVLSARLIERLMAQRATRQDAELFLKINDLVLDPQSALTAGVRTQLQKYFLSSFCEKSLDASSNAPATPARAVLLAREIIARPVSAATTPEPTSSSQEPVSSIRRGAPRSRGSR